MNHILTLGSQSNLQVDITCSQVDLDHYKQKSLQYFQKDMDIKGFRKGHVPLQMVEENINPQYLMMAIYGEAVDMSIKQIIKESPEYRLIGEPYDLHQEPKDDTLIISYKIDLYPQAVVKSDAWITLKPGAVDVTVTADDIQQSIAQLCREHAEYQNIDISDESSIVRLKFLYLDATGAQIDQGVGFRGPEDTKDHPGLISHFTGVKVGSIIELPYSQTDLPKFFLSSKKDLDIANLRAEVTMISKQVIPEFTDENIKKRFSDAGSVDQLTTEITKQLETYKAENAYVKVIDDYIVDVMKHVDIVLPKTVLDAEIKSRKEKLTQRFGGEAQYSKYLEQMTPEQKEEMENSVSSSARESLSKYFVMDIVLKHYGMNALDYQNDSGVALEKDLYHKIMG